MKKLIVGLMGMMGVMAAVYALTVVPVNFPSFTTVVAKAQNTNTQAGASYTNSDPRTTAVEIPQGYPVAITVTYTCASALNSNLVVGLAPSIAGTNYTDTAGDMLTIHVPGTGGAHTNRTFTTNLSASVLGATRYLSVRHISNVNTASVSGLVIRAGIVK